MAMLVITRWYHCYWLTMGRIRAVNSAARSLWMLQRLRRTRRCSSGFNGNTLEFEGFAYVFLWFFYGFVLWVESYVFSMVVYSLTLVFYGILWLLSCSSLILANQRMPLVSVGNLCETTWPPGQDVLAEVSVSEAEKKAEEAPSWAW